MVAPVPAQTSKLPLHLPAAARRSTNDLASQPADALSPLDSALTKCPRFSAKCAPISLLDSALTESAPASPLECALTKTPGVGYPSFPRLQRPASSIQPPEPSAPRGASIPCGLSRLRILPVTTGVYESVWQLGLTLPLYWRERRSAGWPIFWSTTRSKLTCCHRQ